MHVVRQFLLIAVTVLVMWAPAPATAADARQWILMQHVGEVWITNDQFVPVALKPNVVVPEKSIVVTGDRGRAILSRGGEQIVLQPRTRLVIPESRDGTTRLGQSKGTALFRVERKALPHFKVDAPFMAAVVKGTVFKITVTNTETRLDVTEGSVLVSASKGDAATLVAPGMTASIKTYNPAVIDLTGRDGRQRKVIADEEDQPTERLQLAPGNDGQGQGPGGPQQEARLNNIVLRDGLGPRSGRAPTLLRSTQDDTSLLDMAFDAADARDMKRGQDRRVARVENLEHMMNAVQAPSVGDAVNKVQLASGKAFLKRNEVKVESGFAGSLVQKLIIAVAGVLILFNVGKVLFGRKKQ